MNDRSSIPSTSQLHALFDEIAGTRISDTDELPIRIAFLASPSKELAVGVEGDWYLILIPPGCVSDQLAFDDFATEPLFPGAFRELGASDNAGVHLLDFAVIRFRVLTEASLTIARSVLDTANRGASVDPLIQDFIALFQESPPDRAQLTGLWGELALITFATSPIEMARAWVDSTHDFAGPQGARIEVKTTESGSAREHWFSLKQADAADFPNGVVASIVTEALEQGKDLTALHHEIVQFLPPDDRDKFDRNYWRRVGNAGATATEMAFDIDTAQRLLALIPFRNVPRPEFGVASPLIRECKWKVDFTNAPVATGQDPFWDTPLGMALGPSTL